jgi:hypothetical protein
MRNLRNYCELGNVRGTGERQRDSADFQTPPQAETGTSEGQCRLSDTASSRNGFNLDEHVPECQLHPRAGENWPVEILGDLRYARLKLESVDFNVAPQLVSWPS